MARITPSATSPSVFKAVRPHNHIIHCFLPVVPPNLSTSWLHTWWCTIYPHQIYRHTRIWSRYTDIHTVYTDTHNRFWSIYTDIHTVYTDKHTRYPNIHRIATQCISHLVTHMLVQQIYGRAILIRIKIQSKKFHRNCLPKLT